ncbi:MAG: tyrosine-type recombinase/integrase [Eubacterium sp.]|nr:tyrosine-type recombinase/integrase [Eubacterium sp.]
MNKIDNDSFFKSMHDYLKIYIPKQRMLSENTVKSYKATLNQFLDYLVDVKKIPIIKITLDDLNRSNILDYLDWIQNTRNCSATTRNQRLMALRSFAKYCAISDIENVYISLDINKIPLQNVPGKSVDFLSEDSMKTLLSIPNMKTRFGLRNGFFMFLMYDTAARCQEMLDIKISDLVINSESSYVYLHGKGNKIRSVPITEKTMEHLKIYLFHFHPKETRHPDDYLFYTVIKGSRGPMSPDTVAYFLRQYALEANKINSNCPAHVHPHQFRHTRAIHLYRSGVPLSILSEYLGHEYESTTRIYAYASPEMKAAAISKTSNQMIIPELEEPRWKNDKEMVRKLYCLD